VLLVRKQPSVKLCRS